MATAPVTAFSTVPSIAFMRKSRMVLISEVGIPAKGGDPAGVLACGFCTTPAPDAAGGGATTEAIVAARDVPDVDEVVRDASLR